MRNRSAGARALCAPEEPDRSRGLGNLGSVTITDHVELEATDRRDPNEAPSTPVPSRIHRVVDGLRHQYAVLVLGTLVLAFTGVFGTLAVMRHQGLLTHAFDMGQMLQALWSIRHFAGNVSTITGLSFLGDHARFILYPLAMLDLPARALLVGQALALALGAVPVYLLARKRGPQWAALVVAGLYVMYPALQWMSLFDLHPEVLATPLLLLAFWAVDSGRMKTFAIAIGVALLCREDVSVAVALMGALLFIERRWRVGVVTMITGMMGFGVDSLVQRHVNPDGLSVLAQRYGYLGETPGEILHNLFVTPLTTFSGHALTLNAGLIALGFLAPAIIILGARWTRLLAAFPLVIINLLSTLPAQRSIYFQYGFLVIVFVFIAAADGAARLAALRRAPRIASFTAVLTVAAVAFPFTSPFGDIGYRGPLAYPRPASIQRQLALTFPAGFVGDARAALAHVGAGSVAASPNLLPQLAQRKEIYMFPNPFYTVWYGTYLTRDPGPEIQPIIPPDPPHWVVLDLIHGGPDSPEIRKKLVAMLPSRYTLVYEGTFVQVWEIKK